MDKVQFVYEIYISTTPEELWNALSTEDDEEVLER